jgi:hypothetical protein
MNLLVPLLRGRPDLLADWLGEGSVAISDVLDRLSFVPEVEGVAQAMRDDEGFPALEGSYVAVLTAQEWSEGLELASTHRPVRAPEWVTFIGVNDFLGITLPEDSSPVARLSWFRDVDEAVGRMSLTWFTNSPLWTAAEVSMSTHCSFPDRAQCAPGRCGQCTLRVREAEPRGLVCMCDHMR